jgi:ornithine cyclodeaminase
MRVLDRKAVEQLFSTREAMDLMADALRRYSGGLVTQPLRTILRPESESGLLGTMPCHVSPLSEADGVPGAGLGGFGLKAMVLKPENPARGLDLHIGVVLVFDPQTGEPRALMDAGAVTAVRTSAVSAVATEALARPDAADLAILGSGVQGRAHLRAMLEVRPKPRRVRVWSRTREHAVAMSTWAGTEFGIELEVHTDLAGALRGADLVCSTLACREPLIEAAHMAEMAEGAHINAVGASFRDHREYAAEAVARAAVFVDSRESALRESGDLGVPMEQGLFGPEHIRAELGEVLLGRHPGRTGAEQTTLFKSLGLAVEDVLFGLAAARAAEGLGLGAEVSLG